jgi:hypothetical protein
VSGLLPSRKGRRLKKQQNAQHQLALRWLLLPFITAALAGCSSFGTPETGNAAIRVTSDSSAYEVGNAAAGMQGMANAAGLNILSRILFAGSLPKQRAVDGCGRKVEEVAPGKYEPLPGQEHIKCRGDE